MEYTNLKTLLDNSGSIVKSHLLNIREKGEDFNVFSILGMETNETKTHSAMLVALLDPKGNHYYQDQFLKFFLKEIGYNGYQNEDLMSVMIKAEYHLGKISEDYASGGFIDILITFPSGNAIAIENKIDARDQPKQMFRYSLYNSGACTLYYLSKIGKHPSEESLFTLTGNDYEIIAYNKEILSWLERCLSITQEGSIVHNAIKQYQILIKKLTNTMEKPLEEKLNTLILNNLEEAKYIHSHYQKAVDSIRENLRLSVVEKLNSMELVVEANQDRDINHRFSKIWLSSDALEEKGIRFGIEPFSGIDDKNGKMFVGILDRTREYAIKEDGDNRYNSYWPIIRSLKTMEGDYLNLSSTTFLEKLSSETDYFNAMVNSIVEQTKNFIEVYHDYCIYGNNSIQSEKKDLPF